MRDQSGRRHHGMAALTELNHLTFASENSRIGELARIQSILESLPLLLPANGKYILEKKADGFHLYGIDRGITEYAIDSNGGQANISRKNGEIKIEFSTLDSEYPLTVHSEPYQSAREGYFRQSQLHSSSASAESRSYGSESGGARAGER
mgnify:CR=1 FL=1